MPNPTASTSRFLPQQQYPPGLTPTSPALSYPSASSPVQPTASTPTATSSYPAYSQYTPAGFVRTLPPSTYTPYHQQSSYHYTPAPTPVLPQQAAAPTPPNPLDSSDPNE